MSNSVFANCNEISCKSGSGKVVAAFPDVCLTPPTPPAGPIPVPYPVTSFSSDASDGSRSVKIDGKEVMLQRKSFFKKCTGDEAATKSQGMGVITHQIQGKVYFAAWSMDVKIEGENVCRHLDITTSNHASDPGQTPPLPEMEAMALPADLAKACECKYNRKKNAKGTPASGDKPKNNTPTSEQTAHVNKAGSQCWRPGCLDPKQGTFIADHQPSLVERWYKGGCHDERFGDNSVSTPGAPEGNNEYQELRPRCKACYRDVYSSISLTSPSGKKVPEGSMESGKSRKFQTMTFEKFGQAPKDC
jgi:Domain of unknown function (DUF4150)